ncbi:hypothetical protein GLOTRDRAFT_99304 [Gloeophyllum trabeum ATCC 11539]|uniref:Succinate dehydrogenase assembly factor 4, mitochondrial n=1 Tax=Gloeophyllum trabeum (strain ATCC 11539 / FP-39264 / Madison 617) TaxID=670483 RepID=S7QBC1_GLOTA|nr:uncharacterized protein GLOTRDRAFT_99304 [Gloeophyllum trabeum ATCC 11539]EPQ57246.1 hypothetical protein GLOTRDRAFT_99304 [Gloeophyllum trabeum ATCC 11539]
MAHGLRSASLSTEALLPRIAWSCRNMSSRPSVTMQSPPLVRPSPPPLPAEQQQEFEDLVRAAQAPLSRPSDRSEAEAELAMHPDARAPLKAEFEGEVNPRTGEIGGPKREPVKKWRDDEGDWSFKGRVSDF